MFKLTQKTSSGFSIMYVECYCGKKISFLNGICPIICPHCSEILPDATTIHEKDKERIVYHLDEETFA